jgi:RNA polymerase sigma-70 factor (ECF subfamily)
MIEPSGPVAPPYLVHEPSGSDRGEAMDRLLVEQAQRGDREAFQAVAFGLSDRLFAMAHRVLRDFDGAGDALQVALVRIWRDLPSLQDPEKVEAWAMRILIRSCHDQLRRDRRTAPSLRVMSGEPVSADHAGAITNREEMERAFARLNAEQRAVIVLQYYRDLSLPEIAEILGVPIGTVRSRAHYAKRVLRAAIEADSRPTIEETSVR